MTDELWSGGNPPSIVDAYIRCFGGECDASFIESGFPYSGRPSVFFKRINTVNDRDGFEYFAKLGDGLWGLRRNDTMNGLTADLLVIAEKLASNVKRQTYNPAYPGVHIEGGTMVIPFLDGGVGVDVQIHEHQSTNRVSCRQRTSIRGVEAYRALVQALGFKSPQVHR